MEVVCMPQGKSRGSAWSEQGFGGGGTRRLRMGKHIFRCEEQGLRWEERKPETEGRGFGVEGYRLRMGEAEAFSWTSGDFCRRSGGWQERGMRTKGAGSGDRSGAFGWEGRVGRRVSGWKERMIRMSGL